MRAMPGAAFILLGWLISPWCLGGDLLVSNQSADTVWRLSAENGRKRGEFRTGDSPHEIAVSRDGRTAVVSNYGGVRAGNTLSVLDLATGKPTRTIDLGLHGAPHGLRFLPGDERVLVTAEGSGNLLIVHVGQGQVEKVLDIGDGVGHMLALSPEGRTAYVSRIVRGTVSRIDLDSGRISHERAAGRGAEGLAMRPDGQELWVANRDEGTITVHDPRTLVVRRRMSSRGFPLRIAFSGDGRLAYVVNARSAELSVFDARTKLPLARVPLAKAGMDYQDTALGRAALPIGLAVDPERPRVYIAISGDDRIAVVDTRQWQVIDYWITGREPGAVALIP